MSDKSPEAITLVLGATGSGKPSRCLTAEDIRRIWRSGGLVVLEKPTASDPHPTIEGSK
jgi:type II secretory ATPase GspE/PulE/Tfp pilus assembly ATPase PilB-like protein